MLTVEPPADKKCLRRAGMDPGREQDLQRASSILSSTPVPRGWRLRAAMK